MQRVCKKTGASFEISEHELQLRRKLHAPLPHYSPVYRFRQLLAFWPQLSLSRRKCDYSGRDIVSVYDESCPYPVWHRADWLQHAAPPQAQFNPSREFFEQLWELFQQCAIPHNIGLANENCEYTADWWHSKNCYLSYSGLRCEDCYYCFRVVGLKDCQYSIFSYDSELCSTILNCHTCYSLLVSINCRNCRDSAFLFDCRNCEHCLFCWNLRGKKYCIGNEQLSREEYFKRRAEYDFSSRAAFQNAVVQFRSILMTRAYWKALDHEQAVDSSGGYLNNTSNVENCFYVSDGQDCCHCVRGHKVKDTIDTVMGFCSELLVHSVLALESYDVRYCDNVVRSKYLEYCANCNNCENCFACCGLVDKQFCLLNRQLSKEEYHRAVSEIQTHLRATGEYGNFFPGYFAAGPYEDSLASLYFPLSLAEQIELNFRVNKNPQRRPQRAKDASLVPDSARLADASILNDVFWDEIASRPFQIKQFDLEFAIKNGMPLPEMYHGRALKELFSWMPFSGMLRKTTCAINGREIQTVYPKEFDGRLLSDEAYNSLIV